MRPIDADVFFENLTGYAAPEMVWDAGDIEHKLDEMPTLTLDDLRPKGEWIHSDMAIRWDSKDTCGVCGFHEKEHRDMSKCNYCPNCGAKMGGGE